MFISLKWHVLLVGRLVPFAVGLVQQRTITLFSERVTINGTRPLLLCAALLVGMVAHRQMGDRHRWLLLADLRSGFGCVRPPAIRRLRPAGGSGMSVWADLVGRDAAAATLVEVAGPAGAMTRAWLFTGPPGSVRSVAAPDDRGRRHCSGSWKRCSAAARR